MTALQWDQVGERLYEAGIDRGVLYLSDGRVIPWNGLTGIDDSTSRDVQPYYLDGVKFLERHIQGDFAATLKAFTYPNEFNEVLGVMEVHLGLNYYGQRPQIFNLAYRTRVGNDVDGDDHGYKIHILYSVMAVPSPQSFSSLSDSSQPTEFSWELTSIPSATPGYPPTTHITIDSTNTDPLRLKAMEDLLYGTNTGEPRLPAIDELTSLFDKYNSLVITDNGDGTWTAVDLVDNYITMLDATTFQIDNADATFIDADTYTLSTTTPE